MWTPRTTGLKPAIERPLRLLRIVSPPSSWSEVHECLPDKRLPAFGDSFLEKHSTKDVRISAKDREHGSGTRRQSNCISLSKSSSSLGGAEALVNERKREVRIVCPTLRTTNAQLFRQVTMCERLVWARCAREQALHEWPVDHSLVGAMVCVCAAERCIVLDPVVHSEIG